MKTGIFIPVPRNEWWKFHPTRWGSTNIKFLWGVFLPWPVVPFSQPSWFSEFLQLRGGQLFVALLAYAAMKASCKLSKSDLIFVDSKYESWLRVTEEQQAKATVSVLDLLASTVLFSLQPLGQKMCREHYRALGE